MDKHLFLPYYFDELYEGFAKIEGIIRIENNCALFEFQTKDSLLGIVKSAPKIVSLLLSEIVSIEYKKTLFSSKLFLQTNIFLASKGFPNDLTNELVLKIHRKHSDMAKEFVSRINLRIAEARLSEVENS